MGYMKKMKNYKKGGSKFGMLSVEAGVDNNPNPTAADRIVGAKKNNKKKGGYKMKNGGMKSKKKKKMASPMRYQTGGFLEPAIERID
tara:strand:+ start:496 stop:756 length:261 start_codon:yes stop_codon:yes gene_type:complete